MELENPSPTVSNPPSSSQPSKVILFLSIVLLLSLAANAFMLFRGGGLTGNSIFGESFQYTHYSEEEVIDSNVQGSNLIIHYSGLREIIENKISSRTSEGKVGVFVQDANTGAWVGINEREEFAPASLLKIPIMLAILKKVEMEGIDLDDKVEITQQDIDVDYGEGLAKSAGQSFTVSELLKIMIVNSDNTAKNALKRQLSLIEISNVFDHLGIPNPYFSEEVRGVSPRAYNRLFKSLYFSTYLDPEHSEFALKLATDSIDERLISAGVPRDVEVSHKFGVVQDSSLHDCGIVYHKTSPYFICLMTKDIDAMKSREIIREISRDVYVYIDDKAKE